MKIILVLLIILLLNVEYSSSLSSGLINRVQQPEVSSSLESRTLSSHKNIRTLVDETLREEREYSSSSIIGLTTRQFTETTTNGEGTTIVNVNPKDGLDVPGCSSDEKTSCKTVGYSFEDLKGFRGVLNTSQIILYLHASIENGNKEDCRSFNLSGIEFSELRIASYSSSSVTVNCNYVSYWISDSKFNLTMSNIVWRNFKIPFMKNMETILIEKSEIQNVTISMANFVTIRNCRVNSDGVYHSTLHLNDISNIVVSQTSFEKMAVAHCLSRISSNIYFQDISVDNSLLLFYGFVGLFDNYSVKNSLTIANSRFTASTMRVIEFTEINFMNNYHSESIQYSNIPPSLRGYFSEYSYSGFSVTCLTTRSDLRARNITVENMALFGGVLVEGPGLYARFFDSLFQNNTNPLGGGAIHVRTVFRVFVQNVRFISNSVVKSETGKKDMDYIGGGAIYQYRSVVITTTSYFYNNGGGVFGGGIFSYLPLEYFSFQDNFDSNFAEYGGGYASMDTISVSQLEFTDTNMTNNFCYSSGGAIFTMSSEITFNYALPHTSISGNRAEVLGGGIFFISSTPKFKYHGISKIFVDNYCKSSTNSSNYSSFANDIETTPSYFSLKPGKTSEIVIDLYDMFSNQVPFTQNLKIQMYSNDNIYPNLETTSVSGFHQSFIFAVYLTTNNFATSNSTVNMVIEMKNIPYQKTMTFNVNLEPCQGFEALIKNLYFSDTQRDVYTCGPNLPLIIGLVIIGFICCLICILISISFLVYKFITMRGKVKLLAQKEKAEEELTKKLIDLQTLYNSELENKHSYKEWLIKLEDVELIKKVGEGGGGIVYLANWKRVPVALKTIKLEDDDLDSNDFEHEASLLSSIRHPNIVTFYGVCLSSSAKFMVTEFMYGGSLDTFIYNLKMRKKKISLMQKVQILSNIASGMSYLHDRCIMHRDLKPGNILLSNELTAKITDFGLSKLYSTDSGSMTKTCTVGTLLYMAPEVLLGTNYDEKCDIYSFSIIVWQVLFEESSLFNSSYVDDPKYSSIMTETQKSAFKNLNEAYMIVPKMVTEGLRLPLPSLPLSDSYVDYWIRADCGDKKVSSTTKDNYDYVLEGIFKLIEECWSAEITQRPSFARIVDRFVEFEKSLQRNN